MNALPKFVFGRRALLLVGLLGASMIAGTAGLGCGNATLTNFAPKPKPSGIDRTFRTGVLPVFAGRDCYQGTSCHNKGNNGASGLILGGDTTTPDEIYLNVMSGGNLQRSSSDKDVVTILNSAQNGLLLRKPLATSGLNHSGGKQFGTENDSGYQTILLWSSSGALNN
jgi:hypothetical protein